MDGAGAVAHAGRGDDLRDRVDGHPGGDAGSDRAGDRRGRGRARPPDAGGVRRADAGDRPGAGGQRRGAAPVRRDQLAHRRLPHRAARRSPDHPAGRVAAAPGVDRRGRGDGHERPRAPRPRDGRAGPVRRRDRVVRAGRGDPAADLGHAGSGRAGRGAAAGAARRSAALPAAAPQCRAARADGVAVQHRQRHRRRPARAARGRRRAGVRPPLRHRVPAHASGRRGGRPAAVGARRAAGVPARCLRGGRGLAGRALRRRGRDQRWRAGRVLRVRRVPDDPAADRHRVREPADPRPGLGRSG